MEPRPILVAENDTFIRIVGVVLDPSTSDERRRAFAHFVAHEEPDFEGWCERIRKNAHGIYPAEVRLVDSQTEPQAALPGATALIVESLEVGVAELEAGRQLAVVQKFGTVIRNIDIPACASRGLTVLTLRRRANIACAEHTLAMMLSLARKLHQVGNRVTVEQLEAAGYSPTTFDERHTARSGWARVTGMRTLWGSTLGIVGLGEIGRELALRAVPFGMKTLYYQRTRLPAAEEALYQAQYAQLDSLLAESDWVCVLVPSTPATQNLIDRARFAEMKPGACLINISRPEIVDRQAVREALDSGSLGGLALDPPYGEPARADDPLLTYPNVLLTPRIAAQPRFNGLNDIEEMIVGLARALGLSAP